MYIYHRKTGLLEETPDPEEPGFLGKIKNEGERGWHSGLAGLYTLAAEGGADTFDQIAEERKRVLSVPLSKELEKFGKSKGFIEAIKNVAESPSVIPQLTAQSLAQTVPTVAPLAALGTTVGPLGTAAGVGAGSFITDYSAELLGFLEEKKVDTTNPASLRKAFSDKKLMSEAREQAARHGIPVALIDALSGGIAGRFIKGAGFKPAAIAKEIGTQMGLGATGEAVGQTVAGRPLSAPDILAEALGELGSAPIEVGAGLISRRQTQAPMDKTTDPAFAMIGSQPNQDLFYSRLSRAVDATPLKEGDATQWFNQLKKAPEGFSDAEMTLTGLDTFLGEKKRTKGEVQDYLKTNLADIQVQHLFDKNRYEQLQSAKAQGANLSRQISDFLNSPKPQLTAYIDNEKYNTPGTTQRKEEFITTSNTKYEDGKLTFGTYMWNDGHGVYDKVVNPIVRERSGILETPKGKGKVVDELQPPTPDQMAKMPKAYQDNWKDIGIRNAVIDAAKRNLDFISITPGHIQSSRYGKEFLGDQLLLSPIRPNQPHRFLLLLQGGQGVKEWKVNAQDLHTLVGQDIAKILEEAGEERIGMFKRKEIRVGESGLRNLYDDQLIPKMDKLLTKLGATSTEVQIQNPRIIELQSQLTNLNNTLQSVQKLLNPSQEKIDKLNSSISEIRDSLQQLKDSQTVKYPAWKLTPEVRTKILGGQPLFAQQTLQPTPTVQISKEQIRNKLDAVATKVMGKAGAKNLNTVDKLDEATLRNISSTINLGERQEGMETAGVTLEQGQMWIALNGNETGIFSALFHEMIHSSKRLGIITKVQWSRLTNNRNLAYLRNYIEKNIPNIPAFENLKKETWNRNPEEVVAYANQVSAYKEMQGIPDALAEIHKTLFNRVLDFFLRLLGFENPFQTLRRFRAGKFAKGKLPTLRLRSGQEEEGPAFSLINKQTLDKFTQDASDFLKPVKTAKGMPWMARNLNSTVNAAAQYEGIAPIHGVLRKIGIMGKDLMKEVMTILEPFSMPTGKERRQLDEAHEFLSSQGYDRAEIKKKRDEGDTIFYPKFHRWSRIKGPLDIPVEILDKLDSTQKSNDIFLQKHEDQFRDMHGIEGWTDEMVVAKDPNLLADLNQIRDLRKNYYKPNMRFGIWARSISIPVGLKKGRTLLWMSKAHGGLKKNINLNRQHREIMEYADDSLYVLNTFLRQNELPEDSTIGSLTALAEEEINAAKKAFYTKAAQFVENPRLLTAMAKRHISKVPFKATKDNIVRMASDEMLDSVENLISSAPLDDEAIEVASTIFPILHDLMRKKGFPAHFAKKNMVPGWDSNIGKSLGIFNVHASHHIARNQYDQYLQKAISNLNPKTHPDEFKYAKELIETASSPQNDMQTLLNIGFINSMGLSLATAMLQLATIPMVAGPYLTKFIPVKDALSMYSKVFFPKYMMKSRTSKEERGVMEQSKHVLDPTLTLDLLGFSGAESELLPTGLVSTLNKWTGKSGFIMARMEAFARRSAWLAAFRGAGLPGAKEKIMAEAGRDKSFNYSLKDRDGNWLEGTDFKMAFANLYIDKTFGVFGKEARSAVERGVGKLALQFQQYNIHMFGFMHQLLRQAMGGDKDASKVLKIMGINAILAGGVLGLPGADDLEDLIGMISNLFGWGKTNPEEFARRSLKDLFGNVADDYWSALGADAVMRGPTRALTGIDVSQRAAWGKFPGSDLVQAIVGVRGDPGSLLGIPLSSVIDKVLTAPGKYANEDYLGFAENLTPNAAANLITAYDWYTRGVRTKTGAQVMPEKDVDFGSALTKGIGFAPTKVSYAREEQYVKSQLTSGAIAKRASIIERASEAIIDKDDRKLQRALENLAEWNEKADPEDFIDPTTFRTALRRKIQEKLLGLDVINRLPKRVKGTYESSYPGR